MVKGLALVALTSLVLGCGGRAASPARAADEPEAIARVLTAEVDPTLRARLSDARQLRYAAGPDAANDRPPHVRSASAIRWAAGRLLIVQDDVNVIAVRTEEATIEPLLLPAGPGGRRVFDDTIGNKSDKMDLEAAATLPDGRVVALGSGSTRARERLVVIGPNGRVRMVDGAALYERLRKRTAFAGSQLNVEGAIVVGAALRLFQRGNGAPRNGLEPVNASGDLALADFLAWLDRGEAVPELSRIVQFDLGRMRGARLGFTDAVALADGRCAFLACAEDSADVVRDGEVFGCRFGVIDERVVRFTDVLDERGSRSSLKLEGLETRTGQNDFYVVADMDDPAGAAVLARLRATGL